jgi:hypothetical protein
VYYYVLTAVNSSSSSSSFFFFFFFKLNFDIQMNGRQCATNQYLRKENDPHRYCTGECAAHTKCGPVIVPEEHLQVIHLLLA